MTKKILLTNFYPTTATTPPNHQLWITYSLAMNRATTPVLQSHDGQTHHPTPTRAKIQGTVEFCDAMNIPYFKKDVFRVFDVSKQTDWKMLTRENSSRTRHNADISETRERHSVMTPRHIREMKRILETKGMKARALT